MKAPRLNDAVLAAIESAIIETTGDGETAAYVVRYLQLPSVADRIAALTPENLLEIARAVQQSGGLMMQWPSVLRKTLARLLGTEEPK